MSSNSFMKAGTPTFVGGSALGTGGTITGVAGFTDGDGFVNLTTGTTPAASAGLITITFGGTYATIPVCIWWAANAQTAALTGTATAYPSQSDSTTALNVFKMGSVALPASTAGYRWGYSCHL